MAEVVITLAHHWRDPAGNHHLPGERLRLEENLARTLVYDGYAVLAASPEPSAADEEEPAARRRGR